MRAIVLVVGVFGAVLGGLWLFQGLGLVNVPPILCFANCHLQGPSPMWAAIGFVVMAASLLAIVYALKRRTPR